MVTEHSTKTGLKWGVVGGVVLGVIFPPSILASAAVLGTTGAVVGKAATAQSQGLADELAGAIGRTRPDRPLSSSAVVEIRKAMAKADRIVEQAVDKQLAAEMTARRQRQRRPRLRLTEPVAERASPAGPIEEREGHRREQRRHAEVVVGQAGQDRQGVPTLRPPSPIQPPSRRPPSSSLKNST